MLLEQLEEFGLSNKESKIYLSLLELGPSPVHEIAKASGINRSTTYVLLESLVHSRLVSTSEHQGVRTYNPAPPEQLVRFLEGSVKKYTALIGAAHSVLPELKALYVGVGPKPRVQFFEGLEGIKTAYENVLTSQETVRAYASIENLHKTLPDFFPHYYLRRAKKNVKIRGIFTDTPEARERVRYNKIEAREAVLVPADQYNFSPEINIYDNKVAFMSLSEKFALIIESREIAEALKQTFDLGWEEAKRLNSKTAHHEKKQ
jgi:sugar-specific transcriptional regulator TrmB